MGLLFSIVERIVVKLVVRCLIRQMEKWLRPRHTKASSICAV